MAKRGRTIKKLTAKQKTEKAIQKAQKTIEVYRSKGANVDRLEARLNKIVSSTRSSNKRKQELLRDIYDKRKAKTYLSKEDKEKVTIHRNPRQDYYKNSDNVGAPTGTTVERDIVSDITNYVLGIIDEIRDMAFYNRGQGYGSGYVSFTELKEALKDELFDRISEAEENGTLNELEQRYTTELAQFQGDINKIFDPSDIDEARQYLINLARVICLGDIPQMLETLIGDTFYF